MDALKSAIVASPAIHPLDYSSSNEVILAVDSSHIVAGYILSQVNGDGKCRPTHFGSIMWNKCKPWYSQAKLRHYGLFHVLRAVKVWIIGIKNFIIEADAQYIKGMLNNPDIQPDVHEPMASGYSDFQFQIVTSFCYQASRPQWVI